MLRVLRGKRPRVEAAAAAAAAAGFLLDHEQPADWHWTMSRADAWHYTVELENFAKFGDTQLTEAINVIIRDLKPGAVAMTPEEIFNR